MNVWAVIAVGLTLLLVFEVLKPYVHDLLSRIERRRARPLSRESGVVRCLHCRAENDGSFSYCRNCLGRLDADVA